MGLFMKYYNEIYKYIKNNHPEDVSLMLQPHNMMKEIKNCLSKFNVWFVCEFVCLLAYFIQTESMIVNIVFIQ